MLFLGFIFVLLSLIDIELRMNDVICYVGPIKNSCKIQNPMASLLFLRTGGRGGMQRVSRERNISMRKNLGMCLCCSPFPKG
ncbi:hypothetical protein Pfo_013218 [Paulownia fortunei]|nr:hypothetical protein Pfo_013218 [Paulownia fortunei]